MHFLCDSILYSNKAMISMMVCSKVSTLPLAWSSWTVTWLTNWSSGILGGRHGPKVIIIIIIEGMWFASQKTKGKTKLDAIKITSPLIWTSLPGPLSCHLVILKIACVYCLGALPFEIAITMNHYESLWTHWTLISSLSLLKLFQLVIIFQ